MNENNRQNSGSRLTYVDEVSNFITSRVVKITYKFCFTPKSGSTT